MSERKLSKEIQRLSIHAPTEDYAQALWKLMIEVAALEGEVAALEELGTELRGDAEQWEAKARELDEKCESHRMALVQIGRLIPDAAREGG